MTGAWLELFGTGVAEEFDVRVEEEAVAAAEVDGFSALGGRNGGDGARKIGVNGEFDITLAFGDADEGIRGGLEVGDKLFGGFAPRVIQGDGIGDLVEPPKPVVDAILGDLGVGFEKTLGAGAGERTFGLVWGEGFDDPSASGIREGPVCPRAIAAFAGGFEVAAVGKAVIVVADVEGECHADLAEVRGAGGLFGRLFGAGENRE